MNEEEILNGSEIAGSDPGEESTESGTIESGTTDSGTLQQVAQDVSDLKETCLGLLFALIVFGAISILHNSFNRLRGI